MVSLRKVLKKLVAGQSKGPDVSEELPQTIVESIPEDVSTPEEESAPLVPVPVERIIPEGFIDVRDLIAKYNVAEHAQRADKYFKDFSLADAQFRKPFMAFETPELLTKLGVVLSNIQFVPGMTVIDFGCGPGWLSQSLALMGCRPIAVDVSKNALDLAKTYTRSKYPEISDNITYSLFSGESLDIPSGSVDRIVCFDSFHHVPNQDVVLREFYRVLKADGIAVFCEPGPDHSLHPMSQAEMRMFDVIENDILIEKIRESAHSIGFTDLKISLFSIKPVLCSIQEFSTLSEFETSHDLLERMYRENFKPVFDGLRLFVLFKDAPEKTSKLKDGLRCEISFDVEESDTSFAIRGHVTNVGDATWLPSGLDPGCVNIGLIRRAADGTWDQDFRRVMLLSDKAPPGTACAFEFSLLKAEVPPESEFYIDLVAEFIAWFEMTGGKRVRII